ncbi:9963_t:CDS:1, partial [Dentiscutata heterogama]
IKKNQTYVLDIINLLANHYTHYTADFLKQQFEKIFQSNLVSIKSSVIVYVTDNPSVM